ncbi:acetyl-CoA synthetase-like protein [Obba rivulosa]|uniref:Acetyl-CoA synthetase-like protein n=1 Tax=Obba rivulosa TaxID=1052685 RepID=A0A8E2DTQ1_9APHY|nr:acetyl-CoA synthetase-like protein [Obba rivulosa]
MSVSTALPTPFPENVDYKKQCVEMPGTKKPGQTAHYRSSIYEWLTVDSPNALRTLVQLYDQGLASAGDKPFLGHRPQISRNPPKFADHYVWESWRSVDARRRAIGSGLQKLFRDGVLGGGQMETVGIWSRNIPNWQVVDLALQGYGKVGISLYETLGKDSVGCINHAELSVIFTTADHIPALLKLAQRIPGVKMIVAIDDISPESKNILVEWGQQCNVQVKDLPEFEAFGNANLSEPINPTPDTIATICYTSGTTGNPKGVLLTHGNLANATQANLTGFTVEGDIVEVSFLPLAHIFERVIELCVMAQGGRIGFTSGNPLLLLEDMQILKPNFFPSVPRVLNRLYQAGMAAASAPGLKGALFRRAMAAKLQRLRTTGQHTHAVWDRLVFSKIAAMLGGNLQLVACGSAPISAAAMDFLRISLGSVVLEGMPYHRYGMTENGGTCVRVWPDDPTSSGTVGPPVANTELKLVDVPQMGYTSEDKPNPRGEICMRGGHKFIGYYKDEKNTKEALDEEGWLHTGDVGEFDTCGRLKIIDRVKNIMKLAQGEYVALEHIENVYSASPFVAQIFVYGDSLQSYLLAVIVPEPTQLSLIASNVLGKKISPEDTAALDEAIRDPRVKTIIMNELQKEATAKKLKGFEMIRRAHLSLDPFTPENGCLTPTLKIRRKETYEKYKTELDNLYKLGEPVGSGSKL